MTNNGESIYKIRANFLKMKEHVTRTTRITDKNITRCFVITFEYNMTILPLLKAVESKHWLSFHLISSTLYISHIESAQLLFIIYKGDHLAYFWPSAYTTLATNISYFQIIHLVDFMTWQYIWVWLLFFIVQS